MTPTKQTVYLPINGETEQCICNDYPDWMERVEGVTEKEGYFFTPEQLNEYTQNIIKQALETAAEKGICYINGFIQHSDGRQETQCFLDKQSIKNTFEETYKKFEV